MLNFNWATNHRVPELEVTEAACLARVHRELRSHKLFVVSYRAKEYLVIIFSFLCNQLFPWNSKLILHLFFHDVSFSGIEKFPSSWSHRIFYQEKVVSISNANSPCVFISFNFWTVQKGRGYCNLFSNLPSSVLSAAIFVFIRALGLPCFDHPWLEQVSCGQGSLLSGKKGKGLKSVRLECKTQTYHSRAVCSHTMEPLWSVDWPLYIGNGLENSSRSMHLHTGHDSKLFTCIFSLNPHTNLYEGESLIILILHLKSLSLGA